MLNAMFNGIIAKRYIDIFNFHGVKERKVYSTTQIIRLSMSIIEHRGALQETLEI